MLVSRSLHTLQVIQWRKRRWKTSWYTICQTVQNKQTNIPLIPEDNYVELVNHGTVNCRQEAVAELGNYIKGVKVKTFSWDRGKMSIQTFFCIFH